MWVMGIWGDDDGIVDRMRARAKCRQIKVHQYEVVVKFTCEEDARLFAEDLKNFVKD
jgi:hypothetical protein